MNNKTEKTKVKIANFRFEPLSEAVLSKVTFEVQDNNNKLFIEDRDTIQNLALRYNISIDNEVYHLTANNRFCEIEYQYMHLRNQPTSFRFLD